MIKLTDKEYLDLTIKITLLEQQIMDKQLEIDALRDALREQNKTIESLKYRKISIGIEDFAHLIRGGIVTKGTTQIILADIGHAQMIEMIGAAHNDIVKDR